MLLLSAGIAPQWPALAAPLFWVSATVMLAMAAKLTARLFRDTQALDAANGSWLLGMVSPILAPLAGVPLGYNGMAQVCLSVGVAMWVLLFPIILARMVIGSTLPPGLRPTWFILIVPPLIIFVGYTSLMGGQLDFFGRTLGTMGLFLTAALMWASRDIRRWPFTVAWWAFTFPFDGVAAALLTFQAAEPSPGMRLAAMAAVGLTTAIVGFVTLKTLAGLTRGTLLAPPPVPPVPAAD